MHMPLKRRAVYVLALMLVALSAACNDTSQANKLIDEGNALNQEGNKYAVDGANKLKTLDDKMSGFPGNRAEMKGPAQETIDTFNQSITKLRDAAAKYDEAVKLKVDDKFKEYLGLQTKAIRKEIEKLEALNEMPKQLIDESNKDAETVNKKLEEISNRVTKLNQEQKDFEAQADKVRQDNPSIFKS
jgi:chromosome segregation ATPase